MKIVKGIFFAHIFVIVLFQTIPVHAGPYTDELSKCIVASTTTNDRVAIVKWMFSAASLHPAVKSITSVSEEQLEEANKKTAELLMRLLTESCIQQAKKAIKYEGQVAIQSSFQILGQVAGRELFSSPDVAAGMAGFEKHFNGEKLESLLGIK